MLKAFGFIMNVEHPHRLLCNYCQIIFTPYMGKADRRDFLQDFIQQAWNIANDRWGGTGWLLPLCHCCGVVLCDAPYTTPADGSAPACPLLCQPVTLEVQANSNASLPSVPCRHPALPCPACSLRTNLCVRFKGSVVACGIIFYAARKLQVSLPDDWWELFLVKLEDMCEVCRILHELYL